ncbi:CPBP family intramembrane glutamic endopeptidase [Kordiimonas pumila]|uniref:CPBP family intramembrane glutamic endopeptidase n=1 Tax=Kordiimonas pumila TaxID=2161677 RepID=A0ABV7D4T6_9PROT|nr:type II CAAX endopeptidase family protein [Kordiimonas pumila]
MPAIGLEDLVDRKKTLPAVAVFILLTGLFSCGPYYLLLEQGLQRYYISGLMWCPGLAALLTCKLMGFPLSVLGWKWGLARWQCMAFGLPILYGLCAYAFIWAGGFAGVLNPRYINEAGAHLGLMGWSTEAVLVLSIFVFGGLAMVWRISNALGEEIGWRGLLVPMLMRRFSFSVTSFIIGLLWALWHAPLIFYTSYNAGPYGLEWQFLNFSILLVSMSFIMTYLRLKSGSLWTAAVFHAAHNAYVLSLLEPMSTKYESSWRYIGEFGLVLPFVTAVFALFFWYKARRDGFSDPLN